MNGPNLLMLSFFLFIVNIDSFAQDKHNFLVPPQNSSCDSMTMGQVELEVAIEIISNTVFRFQQNVTINREKGFKEASFYSCNNQNGYMYVKYHNHLILYTNIPKSVWEEMIASGNPGDFYESKIRDNFIFWLHRDIVNK